MAAGFAQYSKFRILSRTFEATAVGLAAETQQLLLHVTAAAVAVGMVVYSRIASYFRGLAAVAVGMAQAQAEQQQGDDMFSTQTPQYQLQAATPRDRGDLRYVPFSYIHAAGTDVGEVNLCLSPAGKWLMDLSNSVIDFDVASDDDVEFTLGLRTHESSSGWVVEDADVFGIASVATLEHDGPAANDALRLTNLDGNKDMRLDFDAGVGVQIDVALDISITGDVLSIVMERTGAVAAVGSINYNNSGSPVNPANDDTVVIGADTYTFKTVLSPAAFEVLRDGAVADTSWANLRRALNGLGTEDTHYGAGTTSTFTAVHDTVLDILTLTAKIKGTDGNVTIDSDTANVVANDATGGVDSAITMTVAELVAELNDWATWTDLTDIISAELVQPDAQAVPSNATNTGADVVSETYDGLGDFTVPEFSDPTSLEQLEGTERVVEIDAPLLGAAIFITFVSQIEDGDEINGYFAFRR